MFSERAAGCGLRCPRPAAYQLPREGVEIIHARRQPWNDPLSYAAVWRAPRAPEHPETLESLRREYYASRARDYLRDWIAGDPAPTPAQRRELAALLVGGGADAAA